MSNAPDHLKAQQMSSDGYVSLEFSKDVLDSIRQQPDVVARRLASKLRASRNDAEVHGNLWIAIEDVFRHLLEPNDAATIDTVSEPRWRAARGARCTRAHAERMCALKHTR